MRLLLKSKNFVTAAKQVFKQQRRRDHIKMELEFNKVKVSRFGGYQLLLKNPLKFQTPKCLLRYGADGKYASLSLFISDKFRTQWTKLEEDIVQNSTDTLREKFGESFNLQDYFGTSLRYSDWGTTLQLSIGVYNGKTSTTCFDSINQTIPYTSLSANKNVVVLLQVLGIWLKSEKAGIKCKLLEIKDYGFAQPEFDDLLPVSDDDDSQALPH